MKAPDAIEALAALAHEHRLAVFRLLVETGPEGRPAGEIGQRVGLLPSSLTFHLQHLTRAGLLTQRRVGRQLFYATDFGVMNALVAYLTENCCGGAACPPACTDGKSRLAQGASSAQSQRRACRTRSSSISTSRSNRK